MSALPLLETSTYMARDAAVEANHRIANNLASLARIFVRQISAIESGPAMVPRELVVDLVKDMAGRMTALGRLHHLLSNGRAAGQVDLDEALSEVIEGFRTTGMFGDCLETHLSAEGCQIDAEKASMLMLVVAEIATNAVKYAHPSGLPVKLTISATMTVGDNLIVHIADDGVGLPEGFDEKRDAGPGLRLVRGLVESVGGRLVLNSDPLGLRFSIELPGTRQQ